MLGEIFKKARPEIQNPATLRRLIVDLIEPEKWTSMQADVKGDIYEGLLAEERRRVAEGGRAVFHAPELIKAIVDCVQPDRRRHASATPPAARAAFCWPPTITSCEHQGKDLDTDQKKHLEARLREGLGTRPEHGPAVHHEPLSARHRRRPLPDRLGRGQPRQRPGDERFSLVLTNPPFGKKCTIAIVNEEGDLEKEDDVLRAAGLLDDRPRTSS